MSFSTIFVLVSSLTLGGCSLVAVKPVERYGKKCTKSYTSPFLDTTAAVFLALGAAGSISTYNQESSDGFDPFSVNGFFLNMGVIFALASLVYALSAIKGLDMVKRCEKTAHQY